MRKEESFGVIPMRKIGNRWDVLIVQLHAGHWGFPKGRALPDETPLATAKRELFEETGLSIVKLLSEKTFVESYAFKYEGRLVHKSVTYFLAEASGQVTTQLEEIKDVQWVLLAQCSEHLTFPAARSVIEQVIAMLTPSVDI